MTEIKFMLNNESISLDVDPSKRLLDVLREDIGIYATKEGCGEGECGGCAVLLNHQIINSCITPVGNVINKHIITSDAFITTERGQAIEQAFAKQGSVQCGICTPGMVIATESLLHSNPHPSKEEILEGFSGNLCRCTGYNMIVAAVTYLAKEVDLW